MGRPSRLHSEADKAGGAVTATRVGGRCVPVMAGTLNLD
jgi:trans-2,3-dihydro-3-hydroxyanthranilate isomerase